MSVCSLYILYIKVHLVCLHAYKRIGKGQRSAISFFYQNIAAWRLYIGMFRIFAIKSVSLLLDIIYNYIPIVYCCNITCTYVISIYASALVSDLCRYIYIIYNIYYHRRWAYTKWNTKYDEPKSQKKAAKP